MEEEAPAESPVQTPTRPQTELWMQKVRETKKKKSNILCLTVPFETPQTFEEDWAFEIRAKKKRQKKSPKKMFVKIKM